MNTDELKKLLKGSTAVLILENGEPSFVILGYDAYKDLLSGRLAAERPSAEIDIPLRRVPNGPIETDAQRDSDQHRDPEPSRQSGSYGAGRDGQFQHRIGEKESELLDKINKQILALKDEITKEEKSSEVTMVD